MRNFNNKQFLFRLFPLFLIVYEFCTNMSNDMYLPALALIASDFGTKIHLVQLSITAWLAGDAAVQLIVGPLSDRYGRRPILFGGGLLFLLSTLGCALTPSLELLIFFRFLQGIGVCTMMVSGYASIHDLYNDKEAIHVLVWMGTAAVLAPAIGPVLGGVLLLVAGWRIIFLSLFVLGALALIALWFCMPESTSLQSRQSLNWKTLVASYQKIVTNLPFVVSASAFGLLYGGIMGWITTSPFILISTLQMTPAEFGYMQFPIFGAYIIGAQLVKQLIEKRNLESLIHSGLIVSFLAGLALILFSLLAPSNFLSFVIPMTGYAFGFGFAAAPLNRITLTATAEQKGTAMAVFYLIMIGSGTLISLILSISTATVFYSSVVIAVSVFLGFLLNVLRKKQKYRN